MINTKVLIVEDETIVSLDIKHTVEQLGFVVTSTATNHDDAIKSVKKDMPDIILMDIHLSNSPDGIQTAQEIQKIKNIPIIYLTAFSDEKTICRAVESKPIGYLTKPFKREDLKSNIFLSLYKINQSNQDLIHKSYTNLGFNYYFDMQLQHLYYGKIPIRLGKKEKLLLKILIDAKENIVSFSQLEYQIWPNDPVSCSALRTLIYRVRAKLEYKVIETIPCIGCKLMTF
jgi:DNA-binding response OmpR family regulator